jgi:hypothetical protein
LCAGSQILSADEPAVGFHVAGNRSRQSTVIEIVTTGIGKPLERGGQGRLLQQAALSEHASVLEEYAVATGGT